jgi:integrase
LRCDTLQHISIFYSEGSMSVRKRRWATRSGDAREAWIVDYTDQKGDRHIETFDRKKDADAKHAEVKVDVRAGIHVAPSKSITVAQAGKNWIDAAKSNGLERTTVDQYEQHLKYHIEPFIGGLKLSEVSAQVARKLEDQLRAKDRSPAMVRKVLVSLGSLLADAQERGHAAHNAVRDLRRNRRKGKERNAEKRQKGKLKVGVDIPTPDEIKMILGAAKGRWRPLLIVATFTGLRASELRGLSWKDVDLKANELHVRQRADRYREIGAPKSAAGERTVPFPAIVANTLKAWKLECPKGALGLVFPNRQAKVESHKMMAYSGFIPAQETAGVVTKDGEAKYTGLHALRHFYASWCINRTKDGGLGLPPKNVQERLGHATIAMTLDRYGHLFKGDDSEELDAAASALLG